MLSLKIHNLGDITVFRCAGRITVAAEGLRQAILAQPNLQVAVLDLAEISTIDAAGLGILTGLRNWAHATGKQLKLMNLGPRVEEVLELTNLRSLFEICSLREMIDLLCRRAHLSESAARAIPA